VTGIEDDRESILREEPAGRLPSRRLIGLGVVAGLIVAAGLYGHIDTGRGSAPTTTPARTPAAAVSGAGGLPGPTPFIVYLPATPAPTVYTAGLAVGRLPLHGIRTSSVLGDNAVTALGTSAVYSVFGSQVYESDPLNYVRRAWDIKNGECAGAFPPSGSGSPDSFAGVAASADRIVYAIRTASCQDPAAPWEFWMVDKATGSAHHVGSVPSDAARRPNPPVFAVSSTLFAYADQARLTDGISQTTVKVQDIGTGNPAWSVAIPGVVRSLAAGGSTILVAYDPSRSTGPSPGPAGRFVPREIAWMDPDHHQLVSLGTAWDSPALSPDGLLVAWFDGAAARCRKVIVAESALLKDRTNFDAITEQDRDVTGCAIAVDRDSDLAPIVAWSPIGGAGDEFVAVEHVKHAPSRIGTSGVAIIGLPRVTDMTLFGPTLVMYSNATGDAIAIDTGEIVPDG